MRQMMQKSMESGSSADTLRSGKSRVLPQDKVQGISHKAKPEKSFVELSRQQVYRIREHRERLKELRLCPYDITAVPVVEDAVAWSVCNTADGLETS
jgi:hypothetical protein